MERLKECKCRSENGNCTMIGGFCTSVPPKYCDMAKELKEYKDLEEQGKLLKLPCVVGDTVYRICPKCNDGHDGSCRNCAWENSCSNHGCDMYGLREDGQYPAGECTIVPYNVFWNYIPNLLENIGKTVFLTRAEAESKMN